MPVIYDIETLSRSGLSLNDRILMLDSSDRTMSGSGSNKLESLQFFSQSPKTVEEIFLNLSLDEATDENLTLEFFITGGNSKFAFTDDLQLSKTVSTTSGIFLTESEINRVKSSIESLSYISLSNSEHSFQRTLDPIHFEGNKSSLIFSNLSSLQANLIDLLSEDEATFDKRKTKANDSINDFFKKSSSSNPSFDITNFLPNNSLSDVRPGKILVTDQGAIVESSNGYVNENYNYMVNVLAKALNSTQSFVNSEIAKKIKKRVFLDDFFDNSSFVESFVNEFAPSVDSDIIGQNYRILLKSESPVKALSPKTFNFSQSSIKSQDKIILSRSTRENIFRDASSEIVGTYANGDPIRVYFSTSLSNKSDIKNITLDEFSEESVNQTYSLIGSNQGKGFYLSEDERFEIIYGLTGSSPSVDSITFDQSSEEYTVTLANLDGGFSYEIEFDNIVDSIYNTSGKITGIETNSQTLPISNNFKITLIESGVNQLASFKLLESKDASLNEPSFSGEFSFGDIKFLRSDELIDPLQTISPSWIIRSSDVRKNFQASISPSTETISGETYFVADINNTAGLVFDVQGAASDFVYHPIETSIKGSDETITRKYKTSDNPYNFFRLSSFFSEEKDLFYYTGQVSDGMSPLSLSEESWVNISTNLPETSAIIPSGVEYTGSISISGFSMLFEFKNVISGNFYKKSLPEFIELESDPNVYLISGATFFDPESLRITHKNAVSFTAQSSSHTVAVPYLISGVSTDEIDMELLLQQNTDFLLLEDTSNIIIGEDYTLGINEVKDLSFADNNNKPLSFERSDIKISIPSGTTTGTWTP